MKKVAVFYSDYIPLIDAIKYQLDDIAEIDLYNDNCNDLNKYDLILSCGYQGNLETEYLFVLLILLKAVRGSIFRVNLN